ncbi:hypothetical protein AB1K56_03400 [Microbacterium sp. BWR-S6Y]|uniref:hypothetical protein n=1 Tax=Microbacterium sp. BWR-S6Y TaxID=3232073 RepID=UPI003527C72A
MSAPSAERLALLADMAAPRQLIADLPQGVFREYATGLVSLGIEVEDVVAWGVLFDAGVDLLYLRIVLDAGATDLRAVAAAWTESIPVDYAVAILGAAS